MSFLAHFDRPVPERYLISVPALLIPPVAPGKGLTIGNNSIQQHSTTPVSLHSPFIPSLTRNTQLCSQLGTQSI